MLSLGAPILGSVGEFPCENEGSVSHWRPALKPKDIKPSKSVAIASLSFGNSPLLSLLGLRSLQALTNEKPSSAHRLGLLPAAGATEPSWEVV